VLPLLGELYIHGVGTAGDAVTDFPGQNITGDELEIHEQTSQDVYIPVFFLPDNQTHVNVLDHGNPQAYAL
jgi:hypothetical protein